MSKNVTEPELVKLVEVIEVTTSRGNGTEENPFRIIMQYWSKDGKLLAESDPEERRKQCLT